MLDLHVLIIPSFYSDPDRPLCGVFFKEQAVEAAKICGKLGLVYVEPRSLRSFAISALPESHFQVSSAFDHGILTLRRHGWNPLSQTAMGRKAWVYMMGQLVRRYIREHGRPDVLHAQCALWGGEVARRASMEYGIPFLVTEHSTILINGSGVAASFQPQLSRIYFSASGVSAVTRFLAEHMEPFTRGVRVTLTPNLLPSEFEKMQLQEPVSGGFNYIAVGRLVPQKGYHILLKAFAHVRMRQANCELRIVGSGPEEGRLKDLTMRLGLTNSVKFLGELPRAQVRAAMIESDAFVLPSLYETFGVVVIEAMACGLPVVATCGAPSELLTHESGILVKPGDEAALVEAMLQISRTAYKRSEIRQGAIAKYGGETFRKTLLDFYSQAVQCAASHRG